MAVPARKGPETDHKGRFVEPRIELNGRDRREIAARLYGLGFKRSQIAMKMLPLLSPAGNPKAARGLLRKWEQDKAFRDLVYQTAVVELDMSTPAILEGITAQAKRGRVDAAKLALSIAERFTDKSETPHHMVIELSGLTRPNDRRELTDPDA